MLTKLLIVNPQEERNAGIFSVLFSDGGSILARASQTFLWHITNEI